MKIGPVLEGSVHAETAPAEFRMRVVTLVRAGKTTTSAAAEPGITRARPVAERQAPSDLSVHPPDYLRFVEERLNNRPRKTLNWLNPNDVHQAESRPLWHDKQCARRRWSPATLT